MAYTSAAMRARRDYLPSLVLLHSGNYRTLLVAIATVVTATIDVRSIMGAFSFCIAVSTRGDCSPGPPTAVDLQRGGCRRVGRHSVATARYHGVSRIDADERSPGHAVALELRGPREVSVLLVLVGPPFRLLEMSVSYTLLPELASAQDRSAAVRAIRHAGWIAAALSGAASAGAALRARAVESPIVRREICHPPEEPGCGGIDRRHDPRRAQLCECCGDRAGCGRSPAASALTRNGWRGAGSRAGSICGARWGISRLVIYGSILGWIVRTAVYAVMVRRRC